MFARRDSLSLLRPPLPRDPELLDDEPEFCERPRSEPEPFDEPREPDADEPPPELEPPRLADEPEDDSPEPEDEEAFFAVLLLAFLPDFLAVFFEVFFLVDFLFRVAPPD